MILYRKEQEDENESDLELDNSSKKLVDLNAFVNINLDANDGGEWVQTESKDEAKPPPKVLIPTGQNPKGAIISHDMRANHIKCRNNF